MWVLEMRFADFQGSLNAIFLFKSERFKAIGRFAEGRIFGYSSGF
ncbi:hypothetical protein [Alysiella filiformis]|nr:hypothetical protein [Alysiella filiformis]